jgi:hypothetical protein
MVSFKRKILLLLFFLFPNDTLFRFLLPIPNSEFGCYICPEVIAAAVRSPGAEVVVAAAGAGVGEPSGVLSPRRPSNVGGCSYLQGWNRSSVCNGTLSAGVCSLWLSGPKHVGIFGCNTMFFPHFRALELACWLAEPLNQM